MQKETGGVNDYVVIISAHYIIVGQGEKKWRSDRLVTAPLMHGRYKWGLTER
ncbi:hypothetical protein PSFL111601_10235 [Pseudomonas floridensis]